ncbi:hypothetical protein PHAVU_010G021400 [Phaseolus vulgaris]|uniref:Uncharacterized protein n=1 Tax=Phaseolus vulgaris TaxID=3885 RepID=V7API4_PHAVU|nr:hypothetical protein PHAVU_010G021400g [Phaseolus vulgaris]ESW06121.1 hypothetical protein PHAVU_010G021400g [Phaseolus vulgaris]
MARTTEAWLVLVLFVNAVLLSGSDAAGRRVPEKDDHGVYQPQTFGYPYPVPVPLPFPVPLDVIHQWTEYCLQHPYACSWPPKSYNSIQPNHGNSQVKTLNRVPTSP